MPITYQRSQYLVITLEKTMHLYPYKDGDCTSIDQTRFTLRLAGQIHKITLLDKLMHQSTYKGLLSALKSALNLPKSTYFITKVITRAKGSSLLNDNRSKPFELIVTITTTERIDAE